MPTRPLVLLILALAACMALGACGTRSTGASATESSDTGCIEVSDVSGGDGAVAVSDVEGAGLQAALADANNDPGFDTARDATDCEVTDQDPAAGVSAGDGDDVTITVDCSQVDWGNQEGPQWEAFNDAYTTGFDDGCQQLFDQSPTGSLYEDSTEYVASDCESENPGDASDASDVPQDVPADPESAGTDLGQLDGCQSVFENDAVSTLNYGTTSYMEYDCPVGRVSRAAPSPPTTETSSGPSEPSAAKDAKHTGQSCPGKEADGTPILLNVTKGRVRCAGAVALVNEWLRRAPKEGQGSGGALTLYGWECIGALATQPARIGSCQRAGSDAAAFSATIAPGE